jgi:hypothetical protein
MTVSTRDPRQELAFTGAIPMAIHFDESAPPQITLESTRWVDSGKHPAFRALVKNLGTTHAPIDSRLQVVSEAGQRFTIPAGYGQWLMPGKEIDLEFRMPSKLPAGNYSLTTELHAGATPIIQRQDFTVSDFDTAQAVSLDQ